MLRLIVLVATLAAVAQSTTLLYPSSYRQVAWPVQSQYPSSLQYSNYYPYTTVYRYPLEVQLLPYQQKYQYVQQTPYYTQTRTLPLIWGRSFGEHVSPAPSQVSQSVSPYVAPQVSQYPSVGQVAAPAAPVAPVSQPSSFIGQPSSYMGQSGFVSQPVASPVSSGYAQPPLHAGHFVSQLSAPVPVQQQSFASPRSTPQAQFENAYPVSPAFPRYSPAPVQPALIAPQGGQTVVGFIPNGEPVSAHPQSVPVAYSVDYPRTQVVQAAPGGVQQAPAVFSPIPIQQSYVHGQPQPQQQSVGQHQVAQVAIPAGGYSSATYYETAPASVVIPSVPLSQEPIVAADVKSVASKATIDGQTVHSQVQPQVPHQRVQAVQTY